MDFRISSNLSQVATIASVFLALFLVSCGGGSKSSFFPPAAQVAPPDSVEAKLQITVHQGKKRRSVGAVLRALPSEVYKLDLQGIMGLQVGSFFWQARDWTLVVYEEEIAWRGQGAMVSIPPVGLDSIDVHALFGLLWGALPSDQERYRLVSDSMANSVHLFDPHSSWEMSTTLRQVSKQKRQVTLRKRTRLPAQPDSIGIRVLKLQPHPQWKKSPFFIKVPEGTRISSDP